MNMRSSMGCVRSADGYGTPRNRIPLGPKMADDRIRVREGTTGDLIRIA
jgi:hypothetical protein